jgi:hypothetical protein
MEGMFSCLHLFTLSFALHIFPCSVWFGLDSWSSIYIDGVFDDTMVDWGGGG